MEREKIAAILTDAAATVFAARLQTAQDQGFNPNDIKLGVCGAEVFTAWRDMIKNVLNVIREER
jgi:hypothetical protein